MKIDHPKDFNFYQIDGLYLWKYLDLYKLLDLITSEKLHFQRFDKLEDGIEGLTGEAVHLMSLTQNPPLTKETIDKTLSPNAQDKRILEDSLIRNKLKKLIESQKSQFASCWYLGPRESMSMWKVYSKADGIALKFEAKELAQMVIDSAKSHISTDFHFLYYGKVDYKDIWPFNKFEKFDGKFNGLKKDKSYSSENEYRFVTVIPLDKIGNYEFFKLPIGKLAEFNVEIIANPFMEKWQFNGLKILLEKFELEGKLKKSEMKVNKLNNE
jgi:hypothetical protein